MTHIVLFDTLIFLNYNNINNIHILILWDLFYQILLIILFHCQALFLEHTNDIIMRLKKEITAGARMQRTYH